MKRAQTTRGFSLVEVLCAILILGVGIVGLTQGLTAALRSSKESEVQTAAALLAAGQIETLRADGYLTDGFDEGDGAGGLAAYHWEQTISKTDVDGLHQVKVVIRHAKSDRTVFELQTLLFDPPAEVTSTHSDKRREGSDSRRRDRRGR